MLLVAVLFPVAIYLGMLGWINRRARGLLVSGPWDFAGILFAASGFLFLGGPALLGSVMQTDLWRRFWTAASGDDGLPLGRVLLFGVYFLIVVGVSALILRRRQRLTAIYNVDPALVEFVLGQTFEQWHVSFVQTGNVLLIDPETRAIPSSPILFEKGERKIAGAAELLAGPPPETSVLVEKVTTLEVEASAGLCHVTLLWDPPDSLLRREVEAQLRRALAARDAPPGYVGDWLLLASSVLLFLLLAGMGVMLLLRYLPR